MSVPRPRAPRNVPLYALYGERESSGTPETLHVESIRQRSALHAWEISPHRHELFTQLIYVSRGRGAAELDATKLRFRGPCAFFLPALSVHGFHFSRDVEGHVITALAPRVDALLSGSAGELLSQAPRHLPISPRSREHLQLGRAIALLTDEVTASGAGRTLIVEAALAIALTLVLRGSGDEQQHASPRLAASLSHVRRFRVHVDRDFRTERSMTRYAARLGITATQLNRLCKTQLGKSAQDVLHERIALEAQRDLAYTSLSIKEVGAMLGFEDPAYFTRFFSRVTGMSPSAFRARVWAT